MDAYDDEIRDRLSGVAGDAGRSAPLPPGTFDRAVRRHRNRLAAQGATAALAVLALAVAVPRLGSPADQSIRMPPLSGDLASDSPSASPPPAPSPSASPSAVAAPPSPPPSPAQPRPSRSAEPEPTGSTRPALPPAVPPRAACNQPGGQEPAPPGVTVRVEPAKPSARAGETLRLTIRVRNDGPTPVRYETSGQEYDFWADDAAGPAWVWSHGKAFTQPLLLRELQPGAEVSAYVDWDLTGCSDSGGPGAPLPPGRYAVRGLWVSGADRGASWWSDPVTVTITE